MPHMNLNELRPIHQETIVWFDQQSLKLPEKKAEIDAFPASLDDKDIPFEHKTSVEATFSAIKDSIRTVLIVSDRAGYDLVKDLCSGIAFN